jgi:large subunit ribosomal protein L25
MAEHELQAEARERAGKGAARAARRARMVPAVIYGDKKAPVMIQMERRQAIRLINDPAFLTHIYDIKVAGQTHKAMARDVQLDPIKDLPIHIDFLRVTERTKVSVEVPVVFLNEEECPGLVDGGVLNVVRHTVEVSARAGAIPDQIEIDLTGKVIGDSVHISEVALPDGVEPTITDRDFTIATISAPSAMKAEGEIPEDEEEAAEAEGEVAEGEGAEGEGEGEESSEEEE